MCVGIVCLFVRDMAICPTDASIFPAALLSLGCLGCLGKSIYCRRRDRRPGESIAFSEEPTVFSESFRFGKNEKIPEKQGKYLACLYLARPTSS